MFDASVCCDTCGKHTGMDTHICGQCAEDWNDRDQAAGLARINRRRAAAGLAAITRGEDGAG